MTKSYDADAVQRLADQIVYHKKAYYRGTPEISDIAFDRLEDELKRLAPNHPALAMIGTPESTDLPKVEHTPPMLSLQKTYDLSELVRWREQEQILGTAKVDGVSLSLIYENGELQLGKTRGNGTQGEDVTDKVRWVADALPSLKETINVEIRGELYCTEENFVRLSDTMHSLGLDRPSSPRNIVAGLLGRKTHIDLARYFNFFAFNILNSALKIDSEAEQMQWLKVQGFRLPYPRLIADDKALTEYVDEIKAVMQQGEIPIDGVVLSYNSLAKQRALGYTAHHPRYKMSFKWQGETARSVIRSVTWATSRLGIVTPVAVIEPKELSGATITNITLHNAAHVRAYNLKAGDEIEIVRSGEVIPKFLQVINSGAGTFTWPSQCPSCHGELRSDDVRLKCLNTEHCPAQLLGSVLNWIKSAGIDDLSDKRLEPLLAQGLVTTPADLYKLTVEQLLTLPLTKEKMATKLITNIQKSKNITLANFLAGLGIEGAGTTTWEKLIDEFHSLDRLLAATVDAIQAIPGFAEKTAEQITSGLKAKKDLIAALLAVGVTPITRTDARNTDGPLSGKTLVITGALSRPRSEIETLIKNAGGKVGQSVTKATFAVITEEPDSQSSKMVKAKTLGIPIWSEKELTSALDSQ